MQTGYLNLAKRHECTACMACIDACPHNVLDYETDQNGYFRIIPANPDKCTHCGNCVRICPEIGFNFKPEQRECFAAWNRDSVQRRNSASGGVFSAMATYILKRGGIVYGAMINGFDVRHARITSLSELPALQGAKYQPSITTGIYSQVKKDLKLGHLVLFTGLSCQIAALLKFLGSTDTTHLFTADTICGGISTMIPMQDLAALGLYDGIISFRDKEHGWRSKGFKYCLKMKLKDGSVKNLGSDNNVIKSFSSIILKRPSCMSCKFNGIERASDIMMGDFWGDERFSSQHPNGVSCVTVTPKGLQLLEYCDINLRQIDIREILPCNPNLYWSKYPWLRFVPERFIALSALRHNFFSLFKTVTSYSNRFPWTWRLYLRVNDRFRKKFLTSFFK